jgi:hypothetical protein
MKKYFVTILTVLLVISLIIVVNINNNNKAEKEKQSYNNEFEFYNKEDVLGTDITTIINKAINQNIKHDVKKDENGFYINNNINSIAINVSFESITDNPKIYKMEELEQKGLEDFNKLFGSSYYKCTQVTYHESTGLIESMTFKAVIK